MVSIEHFTEEHIQSALELWSSTENIGLSSADEPEALAQFLKRNPALSHVAIQDNQVVGACLCGHDGRRGYIHHLAVADSQRRAGLGSTLLEHCLKALRAVGINKCHAFVFHENRFAELFWEPHSWQRREDLILFSKPC